ncbi:hypothetical protein ACFQI7_21195 [Paenibacillus allorhizosphaerae]|uniref:Uncharacterized protein n=1 Tax=Paenibacillus allorhizosphaerae TaxID=2849866 RepID=A0ABM8VRD3_9BACL|nr:hypothetical protein [Paenibacillus allorhizosphaerae]CAG7655201.1 hypothetical protein PAECIP111802_06040 [Paenibacillus allorhizosphaerae]
MGAHKSSKSKGHKKRVCRCGKKRRPVGRGNVIRHKSKKENSSLGNVSQGALENATRGNLTQGVAGKENATRGNLTHGQKTKGHRTHGQKTKGHRTHGQKTKGHRTHGNAVQGTENQQTVSPFSAPNGFWL